MAVDEKVNGEAIGEENATADLLPWWHRPKNHVTSEHQIAHCLQQSSVAETFVSMSFHQETSMPPHRAPM
jgi:hypothetical protein